MYKVITALRASTKDLPETRVQCNILRLEASTVHGMPMRGSLGNYSTAAAPKRDCHTYYNRVTTDLIQERDAFARYRRGKLILYLLQNRFFCAPARFFIP